MTLVIALIALVAYILLIAFVIGACLLAGRADDLTDEMTDWSEAALSGDPHVTGRG